MKYIAVFCSAYNVPDAYVQATQTFGSLIGSHGYSLVWGGTDTGLMHTIASSVQDAGGKLIGVSIPIYHEKARKQIDELIIAKDLTERKALFLEKCDAIVTLPGGIGTLDEVSEMIELKKQGKHNKPIIILNMDHFYDGLKSQIHTMHEQGFLPMDKSSLVQFAETPDEAIAMVDAGLSNHRASES